MNLSPRWVHLLVSLGHDCVHWSSVGDKTAPDHQIADWALRHDRIVITKDLDFGHLLAGGGSGPSVIQLRVADQLENQIIERVDEVMRRHSNALRDGALVVLDRERERVRRLPLQRPG